MKDVKYLQIEFNFIRKKKKIMKININNMIKQNKIKTGRKILLSHFRNT